MNVNKKIIAVALSAIVASPMTFASEEVDDSAIASLLGGEEYTQPTTASAVAVSEQNSELLFSAQESIQKAKNKMELEERNNTLDIQIEIAQKELNLKQLQTSDEVERLTKEVEKLRDELSDAEEDLTDAEEELYMKDDQINQLRRTESQLRGQIASLQSEKVKDIEGLSDVRLTRISSVGNDKQATMLYGLSVIKRREGEKIGDTITLKKINFDNIVISNGRNEKTIFIIHENIAEGANSKAM